MILKGRIIVCGEYLMHQHHVGIVLPIGVKLGSSSDRRLPICRGYRKTKDRVRREIEKRLGCSLKSPRGNLPLGYGLAGSAALSSLYSADGQGSLNEVDKMKIGQLIHGFRPSGVDERFMKMQSAGIFGAGRWEPLNWRNKEKILLIFPPQEGNRNLADVFRQVKRRGELVKLARTMCRDARYSGYVDKDHLMEYCKRLFAMQIYSRAAQKLVGELVKRGVAAKCTGGLYDTAIIAWIGRKYARKDNVDELLGQCRLGVRSGEWDGEIQPKPWSWHILTI